MKNTNIRILNTLFEDVGKQVLSEQENESVAFMTGKYFETKEKIIFLPENFITAKENDYLKRSTYHLEISPLYINRVLNVAEDLNNTVIMVHSHPGYVGKPYYSMSDDYGESLTSETISKCLNNNPPVGSMLFGNTHINARAWLGLSKKKINTNISVLYPDSLQILQNINYNKKRKLKKTFFDRQTKITGHTAQEIIENLDIGIVGLGGTGSSISEQLVRVGIRNLRLVDFDKFEQSNWARLYGSSWADITKRKYKVDIVGDHLMRINQRLKIERIKQSVMKDDVLKTLANCDVIFSCLDRHAPRAVLNEISYQCYIPIIDVGVGLLKNEMNTIGGSVRASLIGPGLPCMYCQNIISSEVITAENLSPEEYLSRRAEGYVSDLDLNVGSIINYTTLASSLGITIFLDLILNNKSINYSSLILDIASKEVLKLQSKINEDCICLKRQGKGFSIPFSVAD